MTNRISDLLSPDPERSRDPEQVARRKALEVMQRAVERLSDPAYDIECEINRTSGLLGLIGRGIRSKP